ncbi:M23 family metallopeptidase [Shouchella patagoniensis]|uniref:M23 family metallopeptidase n=1 Tax=Shouchella patagoniensis TaxID=228576 RepID=UPI0009956659|nr:M23 family metallopeptidase [Shouchella patagoniensis]
MLKKQSHLSTTLLDGEYRSVYQQTSEDFQEMINEAKFIQLCEDFLEGVTSFTRISTIKIKEYTECQWLADVTDRGIRAYFSSDGTIGGLQFIPIASYPKTDKAYTRNRYKMPIKEEWMTFWGGVNELVNYHYPYESQRYAYDLVMMRDGFSYDGSPDQNENYYAFGKEVVAPLDGIVISLENEVKDNTPTLEINEVHPLGNYVIIKHTHEEYSLLAHFKRKSLLVSIGDHVKAGDLLGQCGNSGHSTEPHIHYQVSNGPDIKNMVSLRIKLDNEPVRGDTVRGFL